MRQNGSKRGRTWRQIGPTWSNMASKSAQWGPRSTQKDPKEAPRGHKNDQGAKNTQLGAQQILDERFQILDGGAKSEKHYNPRFILVPIKGQEVGVASQVRIPVRIGDRGGVSGGVGGEVQNKICTDLGQLFCTPGPSKRGAADFKALRPCRRSEGDPGKFPLKSFLKTSPNHPPNSPKWTLLGPFW